MSAIIAGISLQSSVLAQQDAHSASVNKISVVYSEPSEALSEFTRRLSSVLDDYEVNATVLGEKITDVENTLVIVSAGAQALEHLLRQPVKQSMKHIPILATFIAEQTYRLLIHRYPSQQKRVSAIFSDPNPDFQIKLIKNLYKHKNISIAVMLSSDTAYKADEIKMLAKKNQVQVSIETIDSHDNIYKSLNKISSANVMLAIPDNNIFNLESIRNIILTTYRHDQALVGFSPGMVKAGALATVTSEPEDIAAEIKVWLQKYERSKRLPPARYASFFNVQLNRHVARSLNLEKADPVMLAKSISLQTIGNLSIVKE